MAKAHRPFVAKLGGKQWSIFVEDGMPQSDWGQCNFGTRRISISPESSSIMAWDTLVHELWHALNPEQDDGVVEERASEMAEAILKYGYRFLREARSDSHDEKEKYHQEIDAKKAARRKKTRK